MGDIIKKDKKLLEAARTIFGNLIRAAYISTYSYSLDENNSETEQRLRQNSKNWFLSDESLHFDAQTIYIEFCNGNLIGFTNSEWGGLFLQKEKLKRL